MASDEEFRKSVWLDEEGQLFEYSGQSPAPSKDFSQIVVSPTNVTFSWWKISNRNTDMQRLNPGQIKQSYEDFIHDEATQVRLSCAFGQHMTDYVLNLCNGELDYLDRLPDRALRAIFLCCDLQDVGRLAQVNKHFHQISNDNKFWRKMFAQTGVITDELVGLAQQTSWKQLYFSDKLKIQLQLSRKRMRDEK